MEKILIIDSDNAVCDILKTNLEREGFGIIISNSGDEGIVKFNTLKPDMVMLDVMLSGIDGWQVCREIRKNYDTPIMFITNKSEIFDKILGFELGADDYVVKPFDIREIIARVKAIIKRACANKDSSAPKELFYENMHINLNRYMLKIKDRIIETPPKELELLFFLASNPNRVYTRDQLLDEVWGFEYYGDSRTIDVHIKRIRKKIEGASDKWRLKTVWGVGYKFESEQI